MKGTAKELHIYPSVKLSSSWYELFGHDSEDIPADVRNSRWFEWQKLAKEAAEKGDDIAKSLIEYWTDQEACIDCVHLEKDTSWCKLMDLPNTVNPYLTMKFNMIGMACQGTGREKEGQQELDLNKADNDLPF